MHKNHFQLIMPCTMDVIAKHVNDLSIDNIRRVYYLWLEEWLYLRGCCVNTYHMDSLSD